MNFIKHIFQPIGYQEFVTEIEQRRMQEVIKECENYHDDNYVSWKFKNLDMDWGISYPTSWEQAQYQEHQKLAKKKECHVFNRKKYCYHTSAGEVIIDL